MRLKDADVQACDDDVLTRAATAASEILFGLTAQAIPGRCSATIRPASRPSGWTDRAWSRYYEGLTGWAWWPSWGDCYGGSHIRCCGDERRRIVDLSSWAPVDVTAVRVDGVVLDPSAYRVDEVSRLVRQDGGVWPLCQSMTAPPGAVGTFEVDVTYGDPVPQSGKEAAARLGGELAKGIAGVGTNLPARVVNVTRQGVSWSVVDAMTFFKDRRTGLVDVDYFITSINPRGQTSRPRVVSPDIPPSRRVGGIRAPS